MGGKVKNRHSKSKNPKSSSTSQQVQRSESEDANIQKEYVVLTRNESSAGQTKEVLDDFSDYNTFSSGKGSSSDPNSSSSPGGSNDTKKKVQFRTPPPPQEAKSSYLDSDPWSPAPYSAFKLLISARFASALWTTIYDCDETFNYYEPMHYLLYGKGFQTWEYSPVYALRSYTYILLHAVPAKIYQYLLKPNPLLIFFFIRCLLAFVSTCCEVYLYKMVRKTLGGNISSIALVTSLFSTGMFISSTALLPSSFSSYMTAFAFGAWLNEQYPLSIFSIALSGLLSWPFAALTGFFIAIDILLLKRKILLFICWSIISLVVILIPIIVIDSSYYGKLVIAPLNIVKYNIFSSKGPDLYGTEPWTFYMLNGFLNFNLSFIFALLSPFFLFFGYFKGEQVLKKSMIIATFFLWLAIFIIQPHKEERFLFPVYHLILYSGAIGVDSFQKAIDFLFSRALILRLSKVKDLSKVNIWDYRKIVTSIGVLFVLLSSFIGCSRILHLHYGYRAPFELYFNLHREITSSELSSAYDYENMTLCYGKEWHRFPTSFLVPKISWDVRFIKSEFKGQLPNLFPPFDPEGTMKMPINMNDLNQEELTRYVNVNDCDYLVDLIDVDGKVTKLEPNYASQKDDWTIIYEQPFINTLKSDKFFRSFYIPYFSAEHTKYDNYVLLKRKDSIERQKKKKKKVEKKERLGKEFSDDEEEEGGDDLQ